MNETEPGKRRRPLSERGRQRRARILEETRRLIDARGYASVTMDEIAASAGVTKKTVYDIYGSKDMLLATVMSERMWDLLESLRGLPMPDPFDRLMHILERTIQAVLELPNLAKAVEPLLLMDPGQFSIDEYFTALHRPCLEEMRQREWIASWSDLDFVQRSMLFDQIAIQNFWANGLISDALLPAFSAMSVYRILTPLATGLLADRLAVLNRALHAELAQWGRAPAP